MKRWPRTSLKRRRMKLDMMMERTMRLKLNVYPLLPLCHYGGWTVYIMDNDGAASGPGERS
jgi:hypothetical protein